MNSSPGRLLLAALLLLAACAAPAPTLKPTAIATETPRPTLAPQVSPTAEPIRSIEPGLRVDGMATVINEVDQIADPDHPNHEKENRNFGPLKAGTRVFLVDKVTRKQMTYWQVYDRPNPDGQVGWIPQLSGEDLNLEPFQPDCPTEFPLTASVLAELDPMGGLSCFGQTELTLSGTLHCDRGNGDGVVGGPILDSNRSCTLDNEYGILGEPVTSLLENPPVDVIDGQYLIRGHFDDPGAQLCGPIPFGTDMSAGGTPQPGTIALCRGLFVATNAIARD